MIRDVMLGAEWIGTYRLDLEILSSRLLRTTLAVTIVEAKETRRS